MSNIEDIKIFVTEGYRNILKREPDNKGLSHHIRLIQTGAISKKSFLDFLRTSNEIKKRSITFFVFLGEFGYEILSSHGWLRLLKSRLPDFKIGVASRGGVEFLYEDCCDIYVDITDILSRYESDMFGVNISENDKIEIHKRLSLVSKGYKLYIAYSNLKYCENGILYGKFSIRDSNQLKAQKFKLLTLSKYKKEQEYILNNFPELSSNKYVVLHDRRRDFSWGRTSIDEKTWKEIIDRLISSGLFIVLVGYKPYKIKDSYSIFYKDEFKNIPGVINISDFLDANINNNILYQAIVLQNAKFFLSVWGSIGCLPPLFGVDSYMVTIQRKEFSVINKEAELWNTVLSVGKGRIYCLNTTIKRESIISTLEDAKLF